MAETAELLVDKVLPQQPVRQWVPSLPFALRYLLATRPEIITQVLGIVYRAISGHLIRQAGLTRASAATGAVTLIQRFGSALNIHYHILALDGVYAADRQGRPRFVSVPAPSAGELRQLVQCIAIRIGRSLERAGLITRDIENEYLDFDPGEESPMHGLRGSSITYRIAVGQGAGGRTLTLKNPFRNGTTHILFSPQDFVARLAALVPRPWVNLTRYLGVFAPSSPMRRAIVPTPADSFA
jgi:hypothetical protein